MAVTNYQLGQLNPVVYFINSRGEIWLPPSTEQALQIRDRMRAKGFEFREANSLAKIDELSDMIYSQEMRKKEIDAERLDKYGAAVRRAVRDRMLQRMVSSSTTPYERDFIQAYLQLAEHKREEFQKRFMHDQMYFAAREYDNADAAMDLAEKAVPDSADTACERCRKYRRIHGSRLCHRCAAEVGEEIQRQGGR